MQWCMLEGGRVRCSTSMEKLHGRLRNFAVSANSPCAHKDQACSACIRMSAAITHLSTQCGPGPSRCRYKSYDNSICGHIHRRNARVATNSCQLQLSTSAEQHNGCFALQSLHMHWPTAHLNVCQLLLVCKLLRLLRAAHLEAAPSSCSSTTLWQRLATTADTTTSRDKQQTTVASSERNRPSNCDRVYAVNVQLHCLLHANLCLPWPCSDCRQQPPDAHRMPTGHCPAKMALAQLSAAAGPTKATTYWQAASKYAPCEICGCHEPGHLALFAALDIPYG